MYDYTQIQIETLSKANDTNRIYHEKLISLSEILTKFKWEVIQNGS